jgi:hypothetical protein
VGRSIQRLAAVYALVESFLTTNKLSTLSSTMK